MHYPGERSFSVEEFQSDCLLEQSPPRITTAPLVTNPANIDQMSQQAVDTRQPLRIGQTCRKLIAKQVKQLLRRNRLPRTDKIDNLFSAEPTG